MATMKEVADLANVSVATVSRVLSSPDSVRKETRERVLNAIEKLHYQPNYLGRTLRLMKTRRILVIINTLSNQFFSRVMRGIEDRAKEDNYSVLVVVTRGSEETFRRYANMLRTHEVDGCIITSLDVPESELLKMSQEFPLVCACEPIRSRRVPVVTIDDEAAGYEAVSFLLAKGKKKIALFGAGDLYYSSYLRLKGALRALTEAGLSPFYISAEGFSFRSGQRSVSSMLLEKAELPDAIFAFSDSCAVGAVSALSKSGFDVPKDVSIIGFDNTAISEMFLPSLTTVAQPQHAIGYKAADLLIRQIEGKPLEKKRYTLQHEIITRDSLS